MSRAPRPRAPTLCLTPVEIDAMIKAAAAEAASAASVAAAEAGARKALADLGLNDPEARRDMADLRETLRDWRDIKAEARRTAVRVFVTAVLGVVAAATWLYLNTHRGQ